MSDDRALVSRRALLALPPALAVLAALPGTAGATRPGTAGAALGWGFNGYGQLGDGTSVNRATPTATALPAGVALTAVAVGAQHTLAIGSNGTPYSWGDNDAGQLGTGTLTRRLAPGTVPLPAGVTARAVSAGDRHSLVAGSDGGVYVFGANGSGQLGDGTLYDSRSPKRIALPGGVAAVDVAAGYSHSAAIGADGRVYTWGTVKVGVLGRTGNNRVPGPVLHADGVTPFTASSLAAGSEHTLAVSGGRAYAWGQNVAGQLGDNSTETRTAPVPVWDLTSGVRQVAAGYRHSLAVTTSGVVHSWGNNFAGELGNGYSTQQGPGREMTWRRPGAIWATGLTSVTSVAAGMYHSAATTAAGLAFSWGRNIYGEAGTGTISDPHLLPVPVALPAGRKAVAVAACNDATLAITAP
ncbi:RCC1-like domain-containing protein [Kitasatospora sp. NPDC057500]|uniref:RCC1-like domain-containing protein n=1 Tax=Kitasatospora sp. NPDC057500 TaxID=3346151 RepID=UPI0036A9CC8B